jgi:predicted anti-sigma-YlaC factor YlaD
MTCEELYGQLTDLGEGTLSADVCAEVDRHLAECAGCRQIRQDLQDLARLCRESHAPTTMPPEVRERIATLLSAPGDAPARRPV